MDAYGQRWVRVGTGGGCEAWQTGSYPDGRYVLATDGDANLSFAVIYGYCGNEDCEGTELVDTGTFDDALDCQWLRDRIETWLSGAMPCEPWEV